MTDAACDECGSRQFRVEEYPDGQASVLCSECELRWGLVEVVA